MNFIAEGSQASDRSTGGVLAVAPIEEVRSQVVEFEVVLDQEEAHDDHTVCYRHQCSFRTAPCADPSVLRMEVGPLGARRAPGGFADRTSQPGITLSSPAVTLFATAFVIAATDAGPGSGLFGRLKRCLIRPHLRHQRPRSDLIDARYLHPSQHGFTKGLDLPPDVGFVFCDFGLACLQSAE